MKLQSFCLCLLSLNLAFGEVKPVAEVKRLEELDRYWATVSQAVSTGDFEAYKKTFHKDAVLVMGYKDATCTIAEAFTRWKKEFTATKAGEMEAKVEFRFSHRWGNAETAHERGIFSYVQITDDKKPTPAYMAFEAVLVKKSGEWQMIMEYQKEVLSRKEWDNLATPK